MNANLHLKTIHLFHLRMDYGARSPLPLSTLTIRSERIQKI